jgi:hypothetical protein
MLRSNKSKPVKKFGSFTGVDFEKWFLATSGGGYCKRERESCLQKRERERVVCKRERVKLQWFLATSGGGVEERVFVKEREKERESEAWARSC